MKSITDVQKSVSAKIIEFQKSEKMSLTGMSEITGISLYTIRNWREQQCLPDLYNAYLLSDAMGMSLDELIHGQV